MPKSKNLTPEHKALIGRYLTWAYKSTKESFDRLERKTTQLIADEFIFAKVAALSKSQGSNTAYQSLVKEHRTYIDAKEQQPIDEAKYVYLQHRLKAVEATIVHFLGVKSLQHIKKSYEAEFTRRIWESKEH